MQTLHRRALGFVAKLLTGMGAARMSKLEST
jgi:hypothetical protein